MEIKLGHIIPKPVITPEQCSQYAAAAQAVDQHNRSCTPGQMFGPSGNSPAATKSSRTSPWHHPLPPP